MATRRILLGVGCGVAVLVGACGKTEDPPAPYNRVLDDRGAGAPVRTGPVDLGILQDAATYQGARFERMIPAKPAEGGAAAEVRKLIEEAATALLDGEVDTTLEAINPNQLGSWKDDPSVLQNTLDKLLALLRVVGQKTGQDPLASAKAQTGALLGALTFDELDASNVSVSLNSEALAKMAEEAAARAGQETGAGMPPGMNPFAALGAGPPPSLTVAKQEGKWRIQLPRALTEDEIKLATAVLRLLQDFLERLATKIQDPAVDLNDPAQMVALAQQTMMELMPQLMELMNQFPQLQQQLASLMGGAVPGLKPPGEAGAEDAGEQPPEEEADEGELKPRDRRRVRP